MERITSYEKCTGCKMCADSCPTGAIGFQFDKEGFWYPEIRKDKCINCGKCVNVCPQNKQSSGNMKKPAVYSAWIKDDKIRMNSSSGGVFYALAKNIIMQGGYVVGCQYGNNCKSVYHSIAHTVDDLEKFIGSKYLQSDTRRIYKKVKRLLDLNKLVLFCGTPCQVAALYEFLPHTYSKLVTMDFFCMGVNSPKSFWAYVTEQERIHNSDVRYIHMRNKKQGWQNFGIYMEFKNGKTFQANKDEDFWLKGFLEYNLYIRPSCYQCKYRKIPRIADISVGDFWGIRTVSRQNLFKGVSAVLINSEKGKDVFENIQEQLKCKSYDLQEVLKGNSALEKPPAYFEQREKFFDLLYRVPFSKAVRKCGTKQNNRTEEWRKSIENFINELPYMVMGGGSKVRNPHKMYKGRKMVR